VVLYPDPLPLHIGVMALLKIARMGHPVLRGVAGAIDDPTAPWVRRLVEDMVETMEDAGGAGIALRRSISPTGSSYFRYWATVSATCRATSRRI